MEDQAVKHILDLWYCVGIPALILWFIFKKD
jgi:hypothetical protein